MPLRFALILLLLPIAARAQTPGACTLGRAERDLDVGDVFARVFNTGSLFFGNSSEAAYLVPQHTGRSPLYAAGLWVGGLADGELRVAGATYADFEFWPGPLDPATARPPNPNDCSTYDRIWRVSRGDVERFYRTGEASDDLAAWPYGLGAPVLDGDGDPANYDLAAGDQPAISGDQMLWWVMNDVGNVHRNTLVPPIGVEVQVTAFAFADGPLALRQATFYGYRMIDRSEVRLDSTYLMFFADSDLGDSSDDYIGSDTARSMVYVYNADNSDGTGSGTSYGMAPPAAGFQLVQGAVGRPDGRDGDHDGETDEPGERLDMTAAMALPNASPAPVTFPNRASEFYPFMHGQWIDGTPITEGGFGYQSGGPVTTFMFPGDPVLGRFWSERCPNRPTCGPANPTGTRYMFLGSGPFRLEPGVPQDVLLAIPFARGTSNLDSVTELRRAADLIRNAYEAGYLDPRHVAGFEPPPLPAGVELHRPAPNPFTDAAVIRYALPAGAHVRIALADVLGREIAVLEDGPREAGPHEVTVDGRALAPGVYVARVWVDGQAAAALPLTRR